MVSMPIVVALVVVLVAGQVKSPVGVKDLEHRVEVAVNTQRRSHGLSEVASNGKLAEVARAHSRDMARRGFFSHVNPEGRDARQRLRAASFECRHIVSENLYMTSLYSRVTITNGKKTYDWKTPERLAAEVVDGWMNSQGHRQNILTMGYTGAGVGIAIASDDNVYVTQVFCG
jgi:uncharacterized protein YkwD